MPRSDFKFYIFAEIVVKRKVSADFRALLQMSSKPNNVL